MSEDVTFQKAPLSDDEKREKDMMNELEESFGDAVDFHTLRAEDITKLVARLAQVLAQEADLLEQMQVAKIAPLQREKRLLVNALEVIKKQLPRNKGFLEALDDQERDDLQSVILIFNEILEENYARLNTARLVNKQIVDAITEVVKEQTTQDAYNEKGKTGHSESSMRPLSLDEKI